MKDLKQRNDMIRFSFKKKIILTLAGRINWREEGIVAGKPVGH